MNTCHLDSTIVSDMLGQSIDRITSMSEFIYNTVHLDEKQRYWLSQTCHRCLNIAQNAISELEQNNPSSLAAIADDIRLINDAHALTLKVVNHDKQTTFN